MHFARLEEPYMILDTYLSHDFWHVGINTHTGMHWKVPSLMKKQFKICLVRFRVMGQAENFSTRACVCVRARDTERQHILLLFVFLFCANESEKKKKTRIYLVAIFFHFWNIHKFTHKMYNTNLTFIFIEFWFAYYELKWKRMFFFVFFR